MDTRSLTCVYDKFNQIVMKMYLPFDGYPGGHGLYLATFLKQYHDKRHHVRMEKLADTLVNKFLQSHPDHVMLFSPYACEDWEYHIYQDKVVFSREADGMAWETDWKTGEFSQLCVELDYGDHEEDVQESTKQDVEKECLTE
jgi:hypothetical protein